MCSPFRANAHNSSFVTVFLNCVFFCHRAVGTRKIGLDVLCSYLHPPPHGRTSRAWDSLLVMKSGCAGGHGFAPGRGNSKESFSSNQETGKVFSPEIRSPPVGKCKLHTIWVSLL